ncbi:MAG: hypothetical protein FWE23_03680 [Chitinivibrionia bacterium]|nr:hypothetical protein [Chitinivibrionia bacterium]
MRNFCTFLFLRKGGFQTRPYINFAKFCAFLILAITFFGGNAFAQRDGLTFSGIFESSVATNVGAGEAANLSYGLEEYANIRMQARVGENGTFFGAVNLIAASGDYAITMISQAEHVKFGGIHTGKYYAALIELERLFFRIRGENVNFDGGIMRIPLGFSNVWGSSDFLNPKNPLKPNARPRAVLGNSLSWFPVHGFKLQGFGITGRDPLDANSGIAGIAADKHWDKLSAQLLYSFEYSDEFPSTASNPWTHRTGLSLKADLELGLILDMLYTHNKELENKADGLSLSTGFDYSFFSGNLIFLAEYLYNGLASSTSLAGGGNFSNRNYLYTGFTYRFSNFTNAGLALLSGLDDASFVSLLTFNHQISQAISLSVAANVPMDRNLFNNDGNHGEFGPRPSGMSAGSHFYMETKLRMRF